MTPLCELAIKYGTDKITWGYTPIYFDKLNERRHEVKNVLEVGVCGNRDIPNNRTGASLFVWRDFFPNAQIIGLDNDRNWMVEGEERIRTFCVDAYDSAALDKVLVDAGVSNFDFICDDAVHDPVPQICLINDLWPWMAPGALYAMEDVCPYKLPHGDLKHMLRFFPPDAAAEVHATHKEERLILVR